MAPKKPHGIAAASTSPTWPLRLNSHPKRWKAMNTHEKLNKARDHRKIKENKCTNNERKDIFNTWIIIVNDKANKKWHLI